MQTPMTTRTWKLAAPAFALRGLRRWSTPLAGWLALALTSVLMERAGADDRPPLRDEAAVRLNAAEAHKSDTRLKFMFQAFGKYRIDVGGATPVAASLHPEPLFRWSNPISTVKDGIAAVFTLAGRPVVYAEFQIHNEGYAAHEFACLTSEPLVMKRVDREVWRPTERWIKFQAFEAVPRPADKPPLRLVQMRKLAAQFAVTDHFGWRDDGITPYELRLMPQPVYRYSSAGIMDGAIFLYAQGTNPEAIVLLEARDGAAGPRWHYAFAPSTIYQLEVRLGDGVVWQKPRYKVFGSYDGAYHAGPYERDPGDLDLTGMMPASEVKPHP
jgi:hypothetical protein